MKKIIPLLALVFVYGCSSLPPSQKFAVEDKSFPPLNVATTEELGDTLVSYLRATTAPSYRVVGRPDRLTAYNPSFVGNTVMKPISDGKRFDVYRITGQNGGYSNVICHDKVKDRWQVAGDFGCEKLVIDPNRIFPEGSFEPAIYVDITQPNFRQELIYNGKVDNVVRFLYRELAGGYMRDAFTQEIQYDLDEGSEIGFKGARLKVLNATNRSITYEVSKHFDLRDY